MATKAAVARAPASGLAPRRSSPAPPAGVQKKAAAPEAEPEAVMEVLREYFAAVGALSFELEGTVGHFAGEGLTVFFNDPLPCADPALQAVRLAVAMRARVRELSASWRKRGYELGFGVG